MMARAKTTPAEALISQAHALVSWLRDLEPADFAAASVLPDWDVRTLVGHLVLVQAGFARLATAGPATGQPLPAYELVRRYRRDVDQIIDSTLQITADKTGAELVDELAAATDLLAEILIPGLHLPTAIDTPRGPGTVSDFTQTRLVELVVHIDDLNRSLPGRAPLVPDRAALATTSRTLAAILAGQHPGRSVEVRIPPYAAVQCGLGDPGPTHTRGTPPNVIETDPTTFLRLATGRTTWAEAHDSGLIHASGLRADLSAVLPLLS